MKPVTSVMGSSPVFWIHDCLILHQRREWQFLITSCFASGRCTLADIMEANEKGDRLAFVWKDGAILELYQEK